MKILHYFLGFPPYRTGGLTKYAVDLMIEQVKQGDKVIALWPGRIGVINKKVRIVKHHCVQGILNYEIINPLPVPLDEGIVEINEFVKPYKGSAYLEFLQKNLPDVIHIHSLMGIHKEFFEISRELKIKTVFTTHDYFGICPKVTMYRYEGVCENDHDCNDCVQCNYGALSLKKIKILQSPVYRLLKNFIVVKFLRNRHRTKFFNKKKENVSIVSSKVVTKAEEYKKLRKYYIEIFSQIDVFHFNSSVAEKIYKKYVTPQKSRVLSLTHKSIADNRYTNQWNYSGQIRITLLATAKPFKGFNVLTRALDEMWDAGKRNFVLNLFDNVSDIKPYMNVKKEGYTYEQLRSIFANTDVLVAPSIWYETFGFTVLEALSYDVPVIVSDHVGAKDIIRNGGIIVPAGNVKNLREALESLNKDTLERLRKSIREEVTIKTWDQFMSENYELYTTV